MNRNINLSVLGILASAIIFTACQTTPSSSNSSPTGDSTAIVEESQTPKTTELTTTYQSPAGEESVAFKLVVDGSGTITEAETTVMAKNPTSVMRQESFSKEFANALKGKKLADLGPVDRIGGSSLTTGAFNKGLDQLKSQL
jgi:hypothetical protein